jgi:hypothetical protein
MIRLTNILNEQSVDKLNVLFVSDYPDDKYRGYARKLIANDIITGTIKTYRSKDDSSELNNLVYYNISTEYDLVVVYCSGLYDDTERSVVENLDNIITICKRESIPVVLITIPTTRFIKDQKKSDFKYIDRINHWIRKNADADYIVDLYTIDDDVYFDNTGAHLNKQGQNIIYKQLIDIISSLDSNVDADAEKKKANAEDGIPFKGSIKNLRALQEKLVALGYKISSMEIEYGRYGQTTKDAVRQFQLKNGLVSTGKVNSKTIDKLQLAPILATAAKQKIQLAQGENGDAMQIMAYLIEKGLSVAGAAGIAGNMKIESNFKTSVLGDHGTSIGLCQWHASRKDKLFSWAEQNGYEALSVEGQLEYLWYELETSYMSLKSNLETIEDPQDAAMQFAKDFERPAVISPERMKYAQQYFDEFNSSGFIGSLKSIWNGIKFASGVTGAMISGTGDKNITDKHNGKLTNSELTDIGNGKKLAPSAARDFLKMKAAAKADGVDIIVGGAYRDLATQHAIFDWPRYRRTGEKKKINTANVAAAYPGTSNHGIGKAIDVDNTAARKWIKANGEPFGWYWGEAPGEPWHFTYRR